MIELEDVFAKADVPWPTRDRKIVCPFHEDSKPSMHIYDDDWGGHGYCFTCQTWANAPMLLKRLTGEHTSYDTDTTDASRGVSAHKAKGAASKRLRELSIAFFPKYEAALPSEYRLMYMGTAADIFQATQWDVLEDEITGYEAEQIVTKLEDLCDYWLTTAEQMDEWVQVQRTALAESPANNGRHSRRRLRPRPALGKE